MSNPARVSDLDTEPLDPAARLQTAHTEWARSAVGVWKPLGAASAGYGWPGIVRMFPNATVIVPDGTAVEDPADAVTIPARHADPATSKAATPPPADPGAKSQCGRLLEAFAQSAETGVDGMTDEQAAELAGVDLRSEFAKRCSDLRAAELIAPTGDTRPGRARHQRIVSAITDRGRQVAARNRLPA